MKPTKNDITGDALISKTINKNYATNYDTIFKKELTVLSNGYGETKQKCGSRCWLEVINGDFVCNKPKCER